MSKRLKQLNWNLDGRTEILLKQIIAYIFHALGFDIDFNLQQIKHGPFLSSKFNKAEAYQELPPPFVKDQNILVFNKILSLLSYTKLYKAKYNNGDGDDVDDDTSVFNDDIERFIPLRSHSSFEKFGNNIDIGKVFFASLKNIYIDTVLLRFLIVNKYNLDKALTSYIESLNWKSKKFNTDKILNGGDEIIFKKDRSCKMIDLLKLGYIYFRGVDKNDRIVFRIEVRKHFRSNCSDKDLERIVVLLIETGILFLKESKKCTKGTMLFDMTGFTLANADLHIVKFLAYQFNNNYPEFLGLIILHNAPKVFYAIWRIIKGWLDPILVDKVRFTYDDELKEFIDDKYIPIDLGGEDTYKLNYIEPPKKNSLKPIDNRFKKLYHQRCTLTLQFIESTIRWIKAESQHESYNYLIQRLKLQQALCKNYIDIDPYIRTRGVYDRNDELNLSF